MTQEQFACELRVVADGIHPAPALVAIEKRTSPRPARMARAGGERPRHHQPPPEGAPSR